MGFYKFLVTVPSIVENKALLIATTPEDKKTSMALPMTESNICSKFENVNQWLVNTPLYIITTLVHIGKNSHHIHQPRINHRNMNIALITAPRSDEYTKSLIDSVVNPSKQNRFDSGGSLISVYFYEIEQIVSTSECASVCENSLISLCHLYDKTTQKFLLSVQKDLVAKPLSSKGFNSLCSFYNQKRENENVCPTATELIAFINAFNKTDFNSVKGFDTFFKAFDIPLKIAPGANLCDIRKEFAEYYSRTCQVRIAICNGQHRLQPCLALGMGFTDVVDAYPMPHPGRRQQVELNDDCPLFRLTSINLLTVTSNEQDGIPASDMRMFGKTSQESAKKSIHYSIRDHGTSVLRSILYSPLHNELSFDNFLGDNANANLMTNNTTLMAHYIKSDIAKNESALVKEIFPIEKRDNWKEWLKKMTCTLLRKKGSANFLQRQGNQKFGPNTNVPGIYKYTGQLTKLATYTNKTLRTTIGFLSRSAPTVKQRTNVSMINYYTRPQWFGPMIVETTMIAAQKMLNILKDEAGRKKLIYQRGENEPAFETSIRKKLLVAFNNNVLHDILSTFEEYGLDPVIQKSDVAKINKFKGTSMLHIYLA